MTPRNAAIVVVLPLLIAIGLSGCTPAATTPVAADTPEPVAKAPLAADSATAPTTPIDPDATLILTVIATATNGSQLDLRLVVHQSTPFDDVAAQTLPVALTTDCGGSLSAKIFSTAIWSFTRANVSAVPSAASRADWPASERIGVTPSAGLVNIAGRGMLADPGYTGSDPACVRDKFFTGPGNGAIAVGIPGDSPVNGTAGRFTRWSRYSWGFTAASGVSLSGCTAEITPLGSKLGGGTATVTTENDSRCVIGSANEQKEY